MEALRLAPTTTTMPAVNQIEVHPRLYATQRPLLEYCAQHGIAVQAYASLGSGGLLEEDEVGKLAARHGCDAAAVLLQWAVGRGLGVIPRSTDPGRIAANRRAVEGESRLTEPELEALDGLGAGEGEQRRFCWDPTTVR